jgi:hypothetical protein
MEMDSVYNTKEQTPILGKNHTNHYTTLSPHPTVQWSQVRPRFLW